MDMMTLCIDCSELSTSFILYCLNLSHLEDGTTIYSMIN